MSTTTNTKKSLVLPRFTSIIDYLQKNKTNISMFSCGFLLHHWVWVTGSIWSHRPPSARRTSWGRRRTFSKGVLRFGSFPGNRRNLSNVRATTTRSSARANFCPMQFLIEKKRCSSDLSCLKGSTIIKTVPGPWGKGDEGVRRQTLLVFGIESQRIKVLRRRNHLK